MPNNVHGLHYATVKHNYIAIYSQSGSIGMAQTCGLNFPTKQDLGGYEGYPYTYELEQITGVAAGTIHNPTTDQNFHTTNCVGVVDFKSEYFSGLNPGEVYALKSTNAQGDVAIYKFYTNPVLNWGSIPQDFGVIYNYQPNTNALEVSLYTNDVASGLRTDLTFTDDNNVLPNKPIIPNGQTQNYDSLAYPHNPNNSSSGSLAAYNCEKTGGVAFGGNCIPQGGNNSYQKQTVDLSGPPDGGDWGWEVPDNPPQHNPPKTTRIIIMWSNDWGVNFNPQTYNCSGSPNWDCISPGDGSGQYSSLAACNTGCTESYKCVASGIPGNVSYNCADPGDGSGTYSSLLDCISDCPGESWNCVQVPIISPLPGTTKPTCQSVVGTNGTYSSLSDCEMSCGSSWDCKPAGMQEVDYYGYHPHISPNCVFTRQSSYRMILMNKINNSYTVGVPMDSTTACEWHLKNSAPAQNPNSVGAHYRYDEMFHIADAQQWSNSTTNQGPLPSTWGWNYPPNPCIAVIPIITPPNTISQSYYRFNTKPHFTNPGGIYDSIDFNSHIGWPGALNYLNTQYLLYGNGSLGTSPPFDYISNMSSYLDFNTIVQMMRDTCPFWGIDWESSGNPGPRTIFGISENCTCMPVECDCIEVPGLNGGYLTNAHCEPICCPIPESWDCEGSPNWSCIDPGDGSGTYSSLPDCETLCVSSWNCEPGGYNVECDCVEVLGSSGQYPTKSACLPICCPPTPSWNCVGPGNCQDPGTGNGQYTTLAACNVACPILSWNCIPCTPIIQQVGIDSSNCGAGSTYVGAALQNPVPNPYNPILVEGPLNPGNPLNLILLISIYYPTVDYVDLYWESIGPTASPPGCNNPVTGNSYWHNPRPGMGFAGSIYHAVVIGYGTSWNDLLNILNSTYQALGNGSQGTNLTPFTGLDALDVSNMMTYTCPYFNASTLPSWTTVNTPINGTMFLGMSATGCGCNSLPGNGLGNCVDPGDGTGTHSTLNACTTVCQIPPTSWDCTNPGTSSNCYDPGCGTGAYTTLTACQNSCITPMPVSSGACGCNF